MEKNTDSVGLSRCSLGYITGLSDAPAQGHSPGEQPRRGRRGGLREAPARPGLRPDRREWACVDEPVVALGFP